MNESDWKIQSIEKNLLGEDTIYLFVSYCPTTYSGQWNEKLPMIAIIYIYVNNIFKNTGLISSGINSSIISSSLASYSY